MVDVATHPSDVQAALAALQAVLALLADKFFALLFGAARPNLRIVDSAVRKHERRYGSTNIWRFRHGWLLLE